MQSIRQRQFKRRVKASIALAIVLTILILVNVGAFILGNWLLGFISFLLSLIILFNFPWHKIFR